MQVSWKHVKGHSGHKWNDRADELADRRAEEDMENEGGPTQHSGEEEADIPEQSRDTTPLLGITRDRSEALRIMRASTLHGVINTSARRKELNEAQIRAQANKCASRLDDEQRRRDCSTTLREMAETKLRSAAARMSDPRERRRERAERKKSKYTTHIVSRIDLEGLRKLKRQRQHDEWGGNNTKRHMDRQSPR
eukprot:1826676-Prymnesium_polylepis.1